MGAEESKTLFDDNQTSVSYKGESENVKISPDPAGSGRGNVVETFHFKDQCGVVLNAGPNFGRPYGEIYYAFDMYIPTTHVPMFGGKFGMRTRRAPRADTPYGDPKDYTFGALNMYSDAPYGRGDYSVAAYYYTEEKWRITRFWNDADPTSFQYASSDAAHQTHLPRGRWFTVVGRVKMNSFDGSGVGRKDGEIDVWLDGKLVLEKRDIRFSVSDSPGGFQYAYLLSQYGGNCSNEKDTWKSPADQSEYFDNLWVWSP